MCRGGLTPSHAEGPGMQHAATTPTPQPLCCLSSFPDVHLANLLHLLPFPSFPKRHSQARLQAPRLSMAALPLPTLLTPPPHLFFFSLVLVAIHPWASCICSLCFLAFGSLLIGTSSAGTRDFPFCHRLIHIVPGSNGAWGT